jgi:HEAT repeat protein
VGTGLPAPGFIRKYTVNAPTTKKIVSLLGEIQTEPALPYLIDLLTNSALRLVSTQALWNFGTPMQQPLLAILRTHPDIHMQAAAAQSLGRIGAASGDTSLTPLYIALLKKPDLNILVKTEVVWAIGKSPDFRAHPILEALENEVWKIRSDKPAIQKLREALDWSLREVRQGGHTGDYS